MHQSFKINFVINTARCHHVLNCELSNFDFLLADLLNSSSIMLDSVLTLLFTLGSSNDHLTRLKYQCCSSLRILHSHDDCSKTSWIVLGIPTFKSNLLQIEFLIEFSRWNQILKNRQLKFWLRIGRVELGFLCNRLLASTILVRLQLVATPLWMRVSLPESWTISTLSLVVLFSHWHPILPLRLAWRNQTWIGD